MRRRDFIALLTAATVWPAVAHAQQAGTRVRRVGVLVGIENDSEGQIRVRAFERGMRDLGWIEGSNVEIIYRFAAADPERLRNYSAELVGLAPDVIVGSSTPVAAALRRTTQSIPVIFAVVTDPVGNGLVTSLARPEGNLTGFTNFELSMGGKWLEILKEISPKTTRIALMFNPANSPNVLPYYWPSFGPAARSFGVSLVDVPVHDAGDIERAMNAFARELSGGLIVLPDNTTVRYRELVVALAAKHRLPAVYPYRYFATSGGLLSYGIDTVDLYVRAANYVNRILRGAKPADLPIQQPTKFEMVINLTAAKAIGLTIPRIMIGRADEIIE